MSWGTDEEYLLNGKRCELTGSWLALNRQKTKVHEHEFKPHGDLWICWCGEAIERPKCEGCDD